MSLYEIYYIIGITFTMSQRYKKVLNVSTKIKEMQNIFINMVLYYGHE